MAEEIVDACEEIVDAFICSRKNSNRLLDLEALLLSDDVKEVNSAVKAVVKLFTYIFENDILKSDANSPDLDDVENKYLSWLSERCNEIKSQLLEHLQHYNRKIQKSSFFALMKILKLEGEFSLKDSPDDTWVFPMKSFQNIIFALLSEERDMCPVILLFQEFSGYDDVLLYALKSVLNLLNDLKTLPTDNLLQNTFALLSQIRLTKKFRNKNKSESSNAYICPEDGHSEFEFKEKVIKNAFSSVWLKFLSFKLPSTLYKKVLIIIHQEILPNLRNPLLLTDFLTNSYNYGGAVSLLALGGLFFLIQNCNLEYPNFYKKLYSLFDSTVLVSKYRARFFFQADLFLSSTHLPAYLVAAFIKRLSRLALESSPNVLLMILSFIENLLIRHPCLKTMIHQPGVEDISSDPFISNEVEPVVSNAIQSSLWEIKTLQNHWHPDVSKKAKFIDKELPQLEWDISQILELTVDDMIKKEVSLKFKEAPLSFDKPLGFFSKKEDKMNMLWSF